MTETTYWLLAEIITIIIVVFICIIVVGGFGERVGSSETSRNTSSSQARASAQSTQAVIAKLRSALALREETIKDLRAKGRRVVADRDRWEAEANRLQAEIAGLKTAATAAGRTDNDANKFRELKAALVKMFHPDALRSASRFERRAREEFFKEIKVEIDRIDGKRRDA